MVKNLSRCGCIQTYGLHKLYDGILTIEETHQISGNVLAKLISLSGHHDMNVASDAATSKGDRPLSLSGP
jgi:hypothetical protein